MFDLTRDGALDRTVAERPLLATRIEHVLASLVLAVSGVVLAGWAVSSWNLTSVDVGRATTKANAAVCTGLLALALLVRKDRFRSLAATFVLLVSTLTVVEYALDRSLGIDQLLVHDALAPTGEPGRMPASSAACLLLLALSLLLRVVGQARRMQVLASFAFVVAFFALVGYVYGVQDLHTVVDYSSVTTNTALVLCLAVAASLDQPGSVVRWAITGTDIGSALLRRAGVTALLVLPIAVLVSQVGSRADLWSQDFGAATSVAVAAAIVLVASRGFARALQVIDERRQAAAAELRSLNGDLEDRVRVGSAQLADERAERALYEDRVRIANDLHDRVIQRIFAAGMHVQSATLKAPPDVAAALGPALQELDTAISALRGAIVELSQPSHAPDAATGLSEISAQAKQMLGFSPRVYVHSPTSAIDGELRGDLMEVAREGLATIARYAEASTVKIDLFVDESSVRLEIVDDGAGLSNAYAGGDTGVEIARLAEQRGGSAVWVPLSPRGTRLVWQAPLAVAA